MTIDQVSEWIQSRQSFYPAQMETGAKIPDSAIWKLLENANHAPSHKRTEPWRYVVFSDNSLKDFFATMASIYRTITPAASFSEEKLKNFENRANTLSHVIVICMKRDVKESIPVQEEEYAVACSVQNILLSMKALNIIGYWGTGNIAFSKEMKEYLNLGEKDKCLGFLQLGVPKNNLPEIKKSPMSPIETKVEWR